ncbi:MAG: hypothetical protein U5L04_01815 [Trueperaceae bacterium]|nr:hypothetical protein [Trueperaceae bacterium]
MSDDSEGRYLRLDSDEWLDVREVTKVHVKFGLTDEDRDKLRRWLLSTPVIYHPAPMDLDDIITPPARVWKDADATEPAQAGDKIGAISFGCAVMLKQDSPAHRPHWHDLMEDTDDDR